MEEAAGVVEVVLLEVLELLVTGIRGPPGTSARTIASTLFIFKGERGTDGKKKASAGGRTKLCRE